MRSKSSKKTRSARKSERQKKENVWKLQNVNVNEVTLAQSGLPQQHANTRQANNPINYDRQCGVINDKGHPCARSLTCKTHTVGAKRAVQGRTRPYDELYLDWQREHNPNFKEPVKKDKVEKKKEKKKGDTEDDEVLAEGEEGRREISELIALTRMAGERCKHHISTLGHIPPQPTLTPGMPPPAAPPRPQQRPAKKPPSSRLGDQVLQLTISAMWEGCWCKPSLRGAGLL